MSNSQKSDKTVGIVGLGAMGQGLATNSARHFKTFGFDIVNDLCQKAAANGVTILESGEAVFEQCQVVILSLPTEDVVKSVLEGIIKSGKADDTVVFDTSTTTPGLAVEMAEKCSQAGITYLDSPVTGGAWGAERAELSIMVGGDETAFITHHDVLEGIGNNITRIGPSGHGQVSKMVNQMLMAAIYTSVNEAFAFAVKHGADINKIYNAVGGGGGRSMLLNKMRGPMMTGTTHDDFGLRQHGKDVRYAMKAAAEVDMLMPITAAVDDFFRKSCEAGLGAIWAGEMWAVWEKMLDINFRATIDWEKKNKD